MKIWITRPVSSQVYSGGMRFAQLWIERPRFDHRPYTYQFDIKDRKGTYIDSVYRELGWTTQSGSLRAKPLLKQDPLLYRKVWNHIYASCVPRTYDHPLKVELPREEYRLLLESDYELKCWTHYKRFLLEVDLISRDVQLVHPEIVIDGPLIVRDFPLTSMTGVTELYLGEDMGRPYIAEEYKDYVVAPIEGEYRPVPSPGDTLPSKVAD